MHEISNIVVCATSKASDQPAHTRSLIRAFASRLNILSVKLLTEHHLEFPSLKEGCTGLSESTHDKMPHCWKSHALAHYYSNLFQWELIVSIVVRSTNLVIDSRSMMIVTGATVKMVILSVQRPTVVL